MKFGKIALLGIVLLYTLSGCTMPLKMSSPTKFEMPIINQHPYTVGLFIPDDVKSSVYVKVIRPFDKMSYPIGEQTTLIFQKNLPHVFEEVVEVDSRNPTDNVDMVLEPSIVKFDSVIPYPAWDPYMATIIYRVDIYDRDGEKIFTQTAVGDAQMSEGIWSGFYARSLCVKVAQKAMEKALRQIIEGLSEAEELKNYKKK